MATSGYEWRLNFKLGETKFRSLVKLTNQQIPRSHLTVLLRWFPNPGMCHNLPERLCVCRAAKHSPQAGKNVKSVNE